MPRTKEQNEALRRATNEKILHAAVSQFSMKGFGAASIQSIAQEAGISLGLVYRHHESKERLFEAVLDIVGETLDEIVGMADEYASAREFFIALSKEMMENMVQDGAIMAKFYPLMYQCKFIPQVAGKAEEIIAKNDEFMRAVSRKVAAGQAAGEIVPGDPLELTQHYFGSMQGCALLRLILGDRCVFATARMLTACLLEDNDYE